MNGEKGDITEKHWFTNRQVISIIVGAIMITFSGTMFYAETQRIHAEQAIQKKETQAEFDDVYKLFEEIEEDLEYERERTDRKYDRLDERLKVVEKPGSDSNKK